MPYRITFLVICATALAMGQQAPPPLSGGPRFEAVTIQPSAPGGRRNIRLAAGRYTLNHVTVADLIQNAYRLHDRSQIVGAPDWLDTDAYDIASTLPAGASTAALPALMQALLADRFQLAIHHETRDSPAYNLVLVPGRAGPAPTDPAFQPPAGFPDIPAGRSGMASSSNADRMRVTARKTTMAALVLELQHLTGRIVVDQTGLAGSYDYTLEYSPPNRPAAASTPHAPPLLAALPAQLGLMLADASTTLDVIVTDHVEKPMPEN